MNIRAGSTVPKSDTPSVGEQFFAAEDLESASELREYVFCERAWSLARRGHTASSVKAQEQPASGTAFHEAWAIAARSGNNRQALWWAFTPLLAALAVWLFTAVVERH
jgi:hypothetical protein